ncbi:YchJ family metal-binding protein [Rhodococcus sp. SMB37]|uniref:YchJ family protein n=1 Tax=Rhodococcus sp. SMB37 TaxID=2512213 RepID=UPI001F53EF58|nr:YchJ family metal-binding protein [Rhodococcus sp. SMB37]
MQLADCCGRFLDGGRASTPEELMRSRYTAFVLGNTDYLLRTWHPSARPASLELDPGTRWTGLEILRATGGRFLQTEGTVEFRARYVESGRADVMHEHSRFLRDDGAWLYLDAAGDR